jgi:NitT/TauT family transport system substrate-binding protein
MRRRDLLFGAAGLAAAGLHTADAAKAGLPAIEVGVANYAGVSPFYMALERGYFRQAGLDVRLNIEAHTAPLVAAGRLDAAITSVTPALFNAVAHGTDIRIVMGRDRVTPGCGSSGVLWARRAAFPNGTGDIRQWIGKRISRGRSVGADEFLFDTIMSRSGIDPGQVPWPQLNTAQAVAALIAGSIDGMMRTENAALDHMAENGIVREEAGRKIVANLQYSYIIFGPGLLTRDVSVGSRFLACCLRGVRDFEAGVTPQFLRDLAATEGGAQSVIRECRGYAAPGGAIDRESVRLARDWSVARGYSQPGVSVDSVIDDRFLGPAQKEAGIAL